MSDITIMQHDAGFVLNATLKRGPNVVDLSGVDEVRLFARSYPGNFLKINALMSFVTDGTDGKVTYTMLAADVNTSGIYRAQFQTITSGVKTTFPNDRYLTLEILKDLA